MGDELNYQDVHDDFFKWIGLSITEWARVEETLFRICRAALGVEERRAAVVFFRTPTLRTRLDLTSELIGVLFPAPERKDGGHRDKRFKAWGRLEQQISDLMAVRNNIVHNPIIWTGKTLLAVREDPDGSKRVVVQDRSQWFEFRKHAAKLFREKESENRITHEQVKAHYWAVNDLCHALRDFAKTLPPPEPDEPAGSAQ